MFTWLVRRRLTAASARIAIRENRFHQTPQWSLLIAVLAITRFLRKIITRFLYQLGIFGSVNLMVITTSLRRTPVNGKISTSFLIHSRSKFTSSWQFLSKAVNGKWPNDEWYIPHKNVSFHFLSPGGLQRFRRKFYRLTHSWAPTHLKRYTRKYTGFSPTINDFSIYTFELTTAVKAYSCTLKFRKCSNRFKGKY